MLHELIKVWFGWVQAWGYLGVFLLMAMESSIIPVPSEIVMPPAAFWAAQGQMSFWGVVLAGTVGSWFGSTVNYWVARWVGVPVLQRYGKYVLMPPEKLYMAETWCAQYGMAGIFVARLLPVVRHLISIPAGVLRMPFVPFSLVTTAGAGLWCAVLSWFGAKAIGSRPDLLDSPEAMISVIKGQLMWFVMGAVGLGVLYGLMQWVRRRQPAGAPAVKHSH
jgi:membrane protein DedA with SNARE-associated domain